MHVYCAHGWCIIPSFCADFLINSRVEIQVDSFLKSNKGYLFAAISNLRHLIFVADLKSKS